MTTSPVPQGRASVGNAPEGFQIVIPARRQIFALLFLPVWLCGWAFGEFSVIQTLIHPKSPGEPIAFLVFWLVGWTLGGAFALASVLWMLAGKEILRFGSGVLEYRRGVGALGYSKRYELFHVKNLRAVPMSGLAARNNAMAGMGWSGGQIAFDYGATTVHVGNGVDEAEAGQLVEQVKRRYNL
jgi:hypothetical protein